MNLTKAQGEYLIGRLKIAKEIGEKSNFSGVLKKIVNNQYSEMERDFALVSLFSEKSTSILFDNIETEIVSFCKIYEYLTYNKSSSTIKPLTDSLNEFKAKFYEELEYLSKDDNDVEVDLDNVVLVNKFNSNFKQAGVLVTFALLTNDSLFIEGILKVTEEARSNSNFYLGLNKVTEYATENDLQHSLRYISELKGS